MNINKKFNFINVDEISENDCNEIIIEYLEYMGLTSIKKCFEDELKPKNDIFSELTKIDDKINMEIDDIKLESDNVADYKSIREIITSYIYDYKFNEAFEVIKNVFPEFKEK